MPSSAGLPRLDPFTEDFLQFPFATLALLREQAPVHTLAEPGWYIVTTMELAREVLGDPARFSNQVSRRTPPPPDVADEVAAIRSRGLPSVPTLLLNDPPAHTRYRRVVQRALTPRALAWMEPLVASVAEELASGLPDGRTVGFIETFARPLPVWAISLVLGLPDSRRDDVHRWTDAATATIGAQLAPGRWPQVERDLLDYQLTIAGELRRRQHEPGDDLLSLIVAAAADPGPGDQAFGATELVSLTRELMVAPGRPPAQRHIAFGQGVHACVGSVLARMEAQHAVRALASHVDRIDVIRDQPLRYLPSLIVRGLAELPVQVRRRRPAQP